MIEATGNIWTVEADATCVTTNGIVKRNGEAVMGAGIALQAKNRYPNLPMQLAKRLLLFGNHVFIITQPDGRNIATFPTKHDWKLDSSLTLIENSCEELVELVNKRGWSKVVLTRPGCANGKLSWSDVKPILEKHFDDRFVVITPK